MNVLLLFIMIFRWNEYNSAFVPTDGHFTYEYIDLNLVLLNVFSRYRNVSCAQLLATHRIGLICVSGNGGGNGEQNKNSHCTSASSRQRSAPGYSA